MSGFLHQFANLNYSIQTVTATVWKAIYRSAAISGFINLFFSLCCYFLFLMDLLGQLLAWGENVNSSFILQDVSSQQWEYSPNLISFFRLFSVKSRKIKKKVISRNMNIIWIRLLCNSSLVLLGLYKGILKQIITFKNPLVKFQTILGT